MNIHEYQAKALFAQYHIPVLRSQVATSRQEAIAAAEALSTPIMAVKAQIHAGGRGQAGGVKLCKTPKDVDDFAARILGMPLKTHQTGPQGQIVRKVLVEEGADIAKELYVSFVTDRERQTVALIASAEGGMDIEEIARQAPEAISRVSINPLFGYQAYQGRVLGFRMGLPITVIGAWSALLGNLYRCFVDKGMMQLEINPLIVTPTDQLIALDAKAVFDDNALFKNKDIAALRDTDEEDPLETRAIAWGLNYVKLDGRIGCMVNGAGLAMATMDVIQLAGGRPANFLDVGGGASAETVKHAFQILLDDSHVKGIFINIFGGIVRCERIAGGILDAVSELGNGLRSVPLVVRLEGTNAKEAKQMLADSALHITVADTLWDGAQKITAAV